MKEWKQLELEEKRVAILELMAVGLSAKRIATKFGISHRTVESHVELLKASYKAKNSVQLIAIVAYYHIIDLKNIEP